MSALREMPAYKFKWRPDPNTRWSGWWDVEWETLDQGSRIWWDAPRSGYAFTRRSGERHVRRAVARLNRGLARRDWPGEWKDGA